MRRREAAERRGAALVLGDELEGMSVPERRRRRCVECAAVVLVGGDAAHNARRLEAVLRGVERGGHRDALVMGAALVCEVTGLAATGFEGARMAEAAIDEGRAARILDGIAAPASERRA